MKIIVCFFAGIGLFHATACSVGMFEKQFNYDYEVCFKPKGDC